MWCEVTNKDDRFVHNFIQKNVKKKGNKTCPGGPISGLKR